MSLSLSGCNARAAGRFLSVTLFVCVSVSACVDVLFPVKCPGTAPCSTLRRAIFEEHRGEADKCPNHRTCVSVCVCVCVCVWREAVCVSQS